MPCPSLCTPPMDRSGTIPLVTFRMQTRNVYGVQYARLLFFEWRNFPSLLGKDSLQRVPCQQGADPKVGID
jgi:hypothetical protein